MRHEWQFQVAAAGSTARILFWIFRHCRRCGRVEVRADKLPWMPWSDDEPDDCADTFQVDRGKGQTQDW